MTLYCAIDLHSTNNVPVVIDENDKILFQKRLPNDLTIVHSALAPYQSELHGVAVESPLIGIGSSMVLLITATDLFW